jgi:putative ATP-binding cassette transporter
MSEAHNRDASAVAGEVFAKTKNAEYGNKPQSAPSRRHLVWRFWSSALGFWRPGGSSAAWPLVIGLVVLLFASLAVDLTLNRWNKWFFDALEQKHPGEVLKQVLVFLPSAAASVALGVTNVYLRMTMQRSWRAWMNDHVLDYWLTHDRYYQLNLVRGEHRNPEYRISEDLRVSTDAPVDFAVGLFTALLSAVAFIVVLWTIGGSLSFSRLCMSV